MILNKSENLSGITFTNKDLGSALIEVGDWLHSLSGDELGRYNDHYYVDMGTPSYDPEYGEWTVVVFYKSIE